MQQSIQINDFVPTLFTMIAARFPSVTNFSVAYFLPNTQPVEYYDGQGRKVHEWPPVVRWRIGAKQYRYVLTPCFKIERWRSCMFFGGTSVLVDYSAEYDKLWQLIKLSVDGVEL